MCSRVDYSFRDGFFSGISTWNYFDNLHSKIKSEVESLSDSDILSQDIQDLTNYFLDKYTLVPIAIFETNIQRTLCETKVKRPNRFCGNPYENDYFELDGVRVTFTIPFDGDPDLFYVKPSTFMLATFSASNFMAPKCDNCGSFTLSLEFTKEELLEKGEAAMSDFLQKRFENRFSDYRKMISYVNNDVESYNDGLRSIVSKLLEKRRGRADSLSAISKALQIPLTVSSNAPNIKPIELKRVVRKPPSMPKASPMVLEPYIDDSDYDNINNIIRTSCVSMEKTARSFAALTEEELRDMLLATLNSHYKRTATGETFRRSGKTDILIEFENNAAFIGECKIWHGEKKLDDAVHQVVSYSTWRDVKVSVIIFNKGNKSFKDILSKINDWVDSKTVSHIREAMNIWKCTYHRQDLNIDIKLAVMAFDLYLGGNC